MKILNYKYLNEAILPSLAKASAATGIKDLEPLVRLNLKNATTMDDAAVVSSYRLIGLEFYEKQSYNNFLMNRILQDGVRVENKMSFRFFVYYENDYCYLYPFTGVDVPRLGLSTIKSYIKLNIFKKRNPNQAENIKIFFNDFTESRSSANEFNTKNYSLEILSKFDDINRENKITNQGILNLPKYATSSPSQTNYYLSFIMVSQPVNVVNKQQDISTNVYYNINFSLPSSPPQNQPANAPTVINNFNGAFKGKKVKILKETSTANFQLGTNAPQGLAQTYPHLTIFANITNRNIQYYIYTNKDITTYQQNKIITDCYIGTNPNEFIQSKLQFN